MPGETAFFYHIPRNVQSCIEECEKYRHLKCVKTSVDKNTFEKIQLSVFQRVLYFKVLVFNNLFCYVCLSHMLLSKILLPMGMH